MSPRHALLALAAGLMAGPSWGQPEGLHDVDLIDRSAVTDPAIMQAEADWMAFRMPVTPGTRAPCCWRNGWKSAGADLGCSLESHHGSHGSRKDSPEVDHLVIYAGLRGASEGRMRMVGEQCPMDAEGLSVAWLGDVDDADSLNWLAGIATGGTRHDSGMAMYAIAKHGDPAAADWLEGQARKGQGRQREEALFWLATERPERAEPVLLDIIDSATSRKVVEHAVFAISQLPPPRADELLFDIARDRNRSKAARKQAFFWLAQSDDEETLDELTALLTR